VVGATGKELGIVVHDYSGHPGQVQLSRALTRRGHRVLHQHCPSYVTGKGAVESMPGDPEGLTFEPCAMKHNFNRYSIVQRVLQ
jgi:colanic acid biosynthesis glycosyl transferase WcaI